MSIKIKEISIPRFYADRLTTSRWVHCSRNKHRCYIYLRDRTEYKIVPMDKEQIQAIDEVLRSFGFTEWEARQEVREFFPRNLPHSTQCGYYIYVPTPEYIALDFPPEIF